MKRIWRITLLIFFVTIVQSYASDFGAKGAMKDSNLSVKKMLTYAIEDEYLARAEYRLIIKKYGAIRPFSNIIRSENTHISMLVSIFKKYKFRIPRDRAADYVILPASLKEAYETGVKAEIENISMYDKFLKRKLPADVREVFERLKRASGNHLRAFRRNLNRYN